MENQRDKRSFDKNDAFVEGLRVGNTTGMEQPQDIYNYVRHVLVPHIEQMFGIVIDRRCSWVSNKVNDEEVETINGIQILKSAQQYVFQIKIVFASFTSCGTKKTKWQQHRSQFYQALQQGNYYFILRLWNNGATLWNFHGFLNDILEQQHTQRQEEVTTKIDNGDNDNDGDGDGHGNNNNNKNLSNDITRNNDHSTVNVKSSSRRINKQIQQSGSSSPSIITSPVVQLAQREVAGYRLARSIFETVKAKANEQLLTTKTNNVPPPSQDKRRNVVIPQVLYFSHDTPLQQQQQHHADSNIQTTEEASPCSDAINPFRHLPWAIFSYVGKESCYFKHQSSCMLSEDEEEEDHDDSDSDNDCSTTNRHDCCLGYHDGYLFSSSMIKIRHEYGFDEPHPRHGRIEETQCAEYSFQILQKVCFPIHLYFYNRYYNNQQQQQQRSIVRHVSSGEDHGLFNSHTTDDVRTKDCDINNYIKLLSMDGKGTSYTYTNMLQQYKFICNNLSLHQMTILEEQEEEEEPQQMITPEENSDRPSFLTQLIQYTRLLQRYIDRTCDRVQQKDSNIPPPLPPVLCHCDLQPQNLMFTTTTSYNNSRSEKDDQVPNIACVMDWEEASYGDPRFELILLCRKVCCNTSQAQRIWNTYQTWLSSYSKTYLWESSSNNNHENDNGGDNDDDNDNNSINRHQSHHLREEDGGQGTTTTDTTTTNTRQQLEHAILTLGPINLWFQLESFHSICIWLLQGWNIQKRQQFSTRTNKKSATQTTPATTVGSSPRQGRNPWEGQHDLLGKLEREFQRLSTYYDDN